MPILQVHYTSCSHGISGQKGFQVRAMSAEVDPNDLREIISRCGYNEMRRLTPEEIAALPTAYRSYRLSSGRIALTRIRYVGEDYVVSTSSNSPKRHGNSFAHTLILPNEAMLQRSIDYWYWHGWKEKLEEDEINSPPPVLPCISTDELITSELPNFKTFLMANEQRKKRLENMIKALFMGQFDSCRRLIIRGNSENNLLWITALQYSFPVSLTKSINSSTYEQVSNTIPQLTATTENSGIVLTPTDKNYYYYVFDDYSGVDSEISTDSKWDVIETYAKLVAYLLIADSEKLEEFYRFIDDIGIKTLDKNTANVLGLVANIYALSIDIFTKDSENRLPELVNYAITIPETSPAWGIISDRLYPFLTDNDQLRIKFLIAAIRAFPENPLYSTDACNIWRDKLLKEIAENNIPGIELNNLQQSINSLAQGNKELANTLLNENTLAEIVKILQRSSPKIAEYVIEEISRALVTVGKEPVQNQPEFIRLLAALENNPKAYNLIIPARLKLADTPETFVAICNGAGIHENIDKAKTSELSKLFIDSIKERDEEFSQQVRKLLPENILALELKKIIKESENPVADYFTYLGKISAIKDIDFSSFVDSTVWITNNCNEVDLRDLAESLLRLDKLHTLNNYPIAKKLLLDILNENVSLQLDIPVNDDVMTKLPDLASDMPIPFKQNRVLIRSFITRAENETLPFPIEDLINLRDDLHALNEEDYLYVSNKILEFCASNEKQFNSINHLQVILTICRPNAKYNPNDKFSEFQKRYLKWLKEVLNRYPKSVGSYTSLWIRRYSEIDRDMILFLLSNKIMPTLAEAIAHYFQINKKSSSDSKFWSNLYDQKGEDTTKKQQIDTINNLKSLVKEAEKGILDHASDAVNTFKNIFLNPLKRK